ncbi:unannotated protein [freshwater metagenome]|uniref:Unannotated protein n=1 Tax=freshwater metagenome TaxID=449393 RepID=A0A6J6HTS8_9ZZZZ|nr:TetR family transcriptional regulator [Actinomycetota bacterium]
MSTIPKPIRYSRAQATQMFLDASIELIDTKPIPDITVQEIATMVGLNHGYVHRYFGTRVDLFTAVADELARLLLDSVSAEQERRTNAGDQREPFDQSLIALARPLALKRLHVIQYLLAAGVDPARFGEESRAIIELGTQQLISIGMSPRMATAQAIKTNVLLWAREALTPSFGLNDAEVDDVAALTLIELANADALSKQLGW